MSVVISEMMIKIAADTARLRSEMEEARSSVGGAVAGIRNTVMQLVALVGGIELGRKFIEVADSITLLDARLKLAVGSGDDYARAQRDIYDISQRNAVGLRETTELYAKLYDPVKRLGGGIRENTAIVEAFATSLRLGGASTAEAASATLQFAQAMGSGKLSGDEFRAMAEASPRFMRALAEGMGVPIERLKEMGSEGKLTADVVGNALIRSLSALQQEAQSLPTTVGAAFTQLKNEAIVFVGALNDTTNATGGLAAIVGGLADWLRIITGLFRAYGEATKNSTVQIDLAGIAIRIIGTALETLIVVGAEVAYTIRGIGKTFSDVATLATAFKEGGLDGVAEAYRRLKAENEATKAAHDKFTSSVVGATDRVLQQREALRNHSLAAGESSNEIARLRGRAADLGSQFTTLKPTTVELTDEQKKAAAAAKKHAEELDKLAESIKLEQQGLSGGYLRDLARLNELRSTGRLTTEQYDRALQDLIAKQPIYQAQARESAKANQELERQKQRLEEQTRRTYEEQQRETEKLRDGNEKLREQNLTLGFNARALGEREAALLRQQAADIEATVEIMGGNAALEEQARLLRERATLVEEGVVAREAQRAREEWERTVDQIGRGLTDSLFRAFEAGKGFMQAFRDTLINAFKTLVLQPTIRAIMAPVTGAVGAMFGGPANAAGMAGAGGGLSNLISGGMNFLTGRSISSAIGGGYIRLGDFLSTSSNNTLAGMGSFMQANPAIGQMLGMAGNAFAGYQLGSFANSTISNGYSVGRGFNNVANIGSAVASAFAGPIGGAIVGAITGLVNRAFGRRPRETTEGGIVGSLNLGVADAQQFADWRQRGGWFRSDRSGTDLSALTGEMASALNAGAGAVMAQTQAWAQALRLPAELLAQVTTDFRVVLTDNAEENQRAITDIFTQYQADLAEQFSGALAPFQRTGETLVQTMERLAALSQVTDALNSMGGIFSRIASSSIDARENIIALAGGIDELVNSAAQFVADYYTEAERAGMQARDVLDTFRTLGLAGGGLTSRQDFRALVESLDVSTAQGQQQLVTLLQIAPNFAELLDYADEQNATLEEIAEAAPVVDVLDQLLPEAQNTSQAVQSAEQAIRTGNDILAQIVAAVREGNTSIATGLQSLAGVVAQQTAVAADTAASAAATAAATSELARQTALAASAPSYNYDLGSPG